MSAYNADIIRQLEEQFDDASVRGGLAAMHALRERLDALINTALEGLYGTRRHVADETERQESVYRTVYERGREH